MRLGQVCVALGHPDVLVAHKLLHGFDVHAGHHKLAAEGVAQLEKAVARQKAVLGQVNRQSIQADEKVLEKARFRKDTVATLRKRLGLSQAELAKLVEVSPQTVLNWEHGAVPRDEQKAKVLGLRKLGARQVREILEGME